MPQIVGVRFKPVTKIYYFDPDPETKLPFESRVIVETARGIELGIIAQPIHDVPASQLKNKLKKVIRKATPVDLLSAEEYRAKEPVTLQTAARLAKELEVPIKVLNAEYSFDGSRLIITFASEQRVDFRELSKQLTRTLESRIEMKQVGARDEAKLLDGYGRCGRRLCCSSWLTEFHPVSIRMAKEQNLPLAPVEISGVCGRLLCCLAYENEQYKEIRATLPSVGSTVKTDKGITGFIYGLNVIKETVLFQAEGEENYTELPAAEVQVLEAPLRGKRKKQDDADAAD